MARVIIAIIAVATTPAFAGDCRYGNYAGQSVVSCDNGYVETHGPHGSRAYGIRNGGFERYPDQAPPPWAIERREAP
ncbi:hypothetical protein [Methylocystis sp.]|uniref:hypothetical protein n=1 Tax=Methylocystis sp. TaxID=1911079 RepID=UPI003D0D0B5D